MRRKTGIWYKISTKTPQRHYRSALMEDVKALNMLCQEMKTKYESVSKLWWKASPAAGSFEYQILFLDLTEGDEFILNDFGYKVSQVNISLQTKKLEFNILE